MKISHLSAIAFIITLLISCNNKTTEPDNIFKFKDYISNNTSGLVSIARPIEISLVNAVESWTPGEEISNGLISISPKTEGTVVVKSQHEVVFKPSQDLLPNTEYIVTINLGKLYDNQPSEYKNYSFQFKTLKPNFSVNTNNIQSYSKNWQYISGVVSLADVTELKKVKQLVSAYQDNKPLKIDWKNASDKGSTFQFKIDSIKRKIDDDIVTIKWNGKPINSENSGESYLKIPGINNFTIVDVEVHQSPEQMLSINFSDPLKAQQNFDGLVSINGVTDPKYVVNGNVLNVYPDQHLSGNVQVDIFQGITNTEDFKLKKQFSELVSFEDLKPEVRLITNSGILPNSRDLSFNFEAVNLSAVDVRVIKIYKSNILQFFQDNNLNTDNDYNIKRVGRRIAKKTIPLIRDANLNTGKWKSYSIDLSKLFKTDPGAIYRVELSYSKKYSLYNCEINDLKDTNIEDDEYYFEDDYDIASSDEDVSFEEFNYTEEDYWDNVTYNFRRYSYNWKQRDNPCHDAYYNPDRIVASSLMASNLGAIVKRGNNNSFHFAVTNILTTVPEAKASITLYNYQKQALAQVSTDKNGMAIIDSDQNAYFALIRKGNDITYLKLDEASSLSLSKFDVSGNSMQRGIKGFIYTERGVYRPGDSIHLSFMLNDRDNPLPKGHPIKLEVTDANGKLSHRKVENFGLNNLYRFSIPTNDEDKTGNWLAKISVGGATFYKSLKVETIKPNRLKLDIDFEDEILTSGSPLNGKIQINWLHGAIAKNLKVEVNAKITSSSTSFENYKDFVFSDPTKSFNAEELTIFDGTVNESGSAKINKTISIGKDAPGMLNVAFLTRAFEAGGDFSMDVFSKKYAPYKVFVGLKSPEVNGYSYDTDKNHQFDVVTVDDKGNAVKTENLEVEVYKIKWKWWWSRADDNLSNFQSSEYNQLISKQKINTDTQGKAKFNVIIPNEERGRYLIRIYDPKNGHASGQVAYFSKNWWDLDSSSAKEAAKMLVFTADKEDYNVGDEAVITFPSGSEGRALISLENGTEVISKQWVETKKGETTTKIKITEEMSPNIYVNISLLQPHSVTENDLPIRLFGVIPLSVENKGSRLEPEIKMPDELRPEQTIAIEISEKNNRSMTYTVAMVDEGLLDLTRYKTPNPWDSFYGREALGVKTWDIYDDVIGSYSGNVDQVFAIGGDGAAELGQQKKANRFKPVVQYLGPFYIEAGETKLHSITIPKYIGSVKTMVVASNVDDEAYGMTEKTTPVKKPLMVIASIPRKLSPSEKVTLPVTVFSMDKNIKNVSLKLNTSDGIQILGRKEQSLSFDKPDEKMAYFELDIKDAIGIGSIEVIASSTNERSTYNVEIDVENPNPISTQSKDFVLNSTAEQRIDFSTFGESGTNLAEIEFSTLPPMDFTSRLKYLIQYPHGCVEQVTSSVFPQLYLTDIFDLTYDKKQEVEKNIKAAIKKIAHFQRPNGGVSYWSGNNTINDWGTSYVGHFMIEAQKKGYNLPLTFMSNWINYQKLAARNWRPSYSIYHYDVAQAYRLYTLALAGKPDLSSMNRLREFTELSNVGKWRLAAAYAIAGHTEAAKEIISKANIEFTDNRYDYYTYGSVNRNRAMALETLVIMKDPKQRLLAETIASSLSSEQWMSTQTTAYSLLAMSKMVKMNGGKSQKIVYQLNSDTSGNLDTSSAVALRDLDIKEGSNTIVINNKNENIVYGRIILSGKLPLGKELEESRGLSVSVNYKLPNGKSLNIKNLKQGQDFVATVTVSNSKNNEIHDVSLTEIFPSGWEIVNTRFTDFGEAATNEADYVDIDDDRVSFYFDLAKQGRKGSTKTFNILLNASYLGTFYLPGVQAEAMYDHDYFVRKKGQWVRVEH